MGLAVYGVSGDTLITRWFKGNTLYATYSKAVRRTTQGAFKEKIVAENGTLPDNGISGSYWYVKESIANVPPTISGSDQNLGDKNSGFSVVYQVNDADNNTLTVIEKLNSTQLRTLGNPAKGQDIVLTLTDAQVRALPINSNNNIQICVDDGQGGITYRNYTFKRVNAAPIISGTDEQVGQVIEPFNKKYTINDIEGDAVTITEKIDDKVIRIYTAVSGQENTIIIPQDIWWTLNIGQHTLKIEAKDANGAISIRVYNFIRQDDKIRFQFKTSIKTDIKAAKIIITPTWTIPTGSIPKVEACNNGFDTIPVWEDITQQVLARRHYNFTNAAKTATDWGINVRITIEKGAATSLCILDGFGGAFE